MSGQKQQSDKTWLARRVIDGLAVLLIVAAARYQPFYLQEFLAPSGQLPAGFFWMVVVADAVLLFSGVLGLVMRRRLYPRWKDILTIVGSLVFCFVVLETAISVYFLALAPGSQSRYLPRGRIRLPSQYTRHHYLGYIPTPGYVSYDGQNRHNSLGFRGDEVTVPKPPDEYRIVVLGGSSTYTENVPNYKASYPYLLGKKLAGSNSKKKVTVVNAGVGGYDTFQSLINLEFRVLDLQPDLIIINHAVNDAHARLTAPQYYRGDNSGRRRPWRLGGEPLFMKSALLRFVVSKLTGYSLEPSIGYYYSSERSLTGPKKTGVQAVLGDTPLNTLKKNPPVFFERNLRNMFAVARDQQIPVALLTWPYSLEFDDFMNTEHYRFAVDQQNEVARRIAREYGQVTLFDLAQEMPTGREFWSDGRHVNERGALRKAYLVGDFVEEMYFKEKDCGCSQKGKEPAEQEN